MKRTNSNTSNKSATSNRSMYDGDVVGQFLLKNAVKVFTASDRDQCVRVGEVGENADFVTILKLCSCGHLIQLKLV